MKIHPTNKTVLCKYFIKPKQEVVVNGLQYIETQFPIYEVLEASPDLELDIHTGDCIATNSEPSQFILDSEELFIIKQEFIAGKILKENI